MRLRRNLLWWFKIAIGLSMFLAGLYIMAHRNLPDGYVTKRSKQEVPPLQPQPPEVLPAANRNDGHEQQVAHNAHHVTLHAPNGYKDWNNYALMAAEAKQTGPAEQGQAYFLPPNLAAEKDQLYKVNGFNARASDDIALNRSLHDLRHPKCRDRVYLAKLPRASVVVPFHNEHWSTLLRTAISAINRAPDELLQEVILVDDASTKGFLKTKLDDYVRENLPKVRVLHLAQRSGLIRARWQGQKKHGAKCSYSSTPTQSAPPTGCRHCSSPLPRTTGPVSAPSLMSSTMRRLHIGHRTRERVGRSTGSCSTSVCLCCQKTRRTCRNPLGVQ